MTLSPTLEKMKTAHKLLGEYSYELKPVERGYANRTLYINLNDNTFAEKPVTQQMKDVFTGGRGFALKLLWDAVTPETKWDNPENELVIANGPICGITAYPGSGKATVVTLGPLTENVVDYNVGGYFAPFLKFSGFDALEIQGKAAEDVIIFIDGDTGRITIEAAPLEDVDSHLLGSYLTDMYSDGDEKSKRGISVLSAGQAAEHIRFALINSTWYDVRRKEIRLKQAGRGGAGRVFRDKKIKGIVVKFSNMRGDLNGVADMALIRKAGQRINKEIDRPGRCAEQDAQGRHGQHRRDHGSLSTCCPPTTSAMARTPIRTRSIQASGWKTSPRACRMAAGWDAPCLARTVWTISRFRPDPMPAPMFW